MTPRRPHPFLALLGVAFAATLVAGTGTLCDIVVVRHGTTAALAATVCYYPAFENLPPACFPTSAPIPIPYGPHYEIAFAPGLVSRQNFLTSTSSPGQHPRPGYTLEVHDAGELLPATPMHLDSNELLQLLHLDTSEHVVLRPAWLPTEHPGLPARAGTVIAAVFADPRIVAISRPITVRPGTTAPLTFERTAAGHGHLFFRQAVKDSAATIPKTAEPILTLRQRTGRTLRLDFAQSLHGAHKYFIAYNIPAGHYTYHVRIPGVPDVTGSLAISSGTITRVAREDPLWPTRAPDAPPAAAR